MGMHHLGNPESQRVTLASFRCVVRRKVSVDR
jgi:hypothetical protein